MDVHGEHLSRNALQIFWCCENKMWETNYLFVTPVSENQYFPPTLKIDNKLWFKKEFYQSMHS